MLDFLSCGFWSVLGGLLTALVISGGLLLYSARNSRRGSVEPLALILCGVLFFLLFFQATLMYGAIGSKGEVMDFISAFYMQFGDDINGPELKSHMTKLIRENPLVSFFIDYGDLEDFDWSNPIVSLRDVIAREYNWYILRRLGWMAVFITLLGGITLFSTRSNGRGGHRKRNRSVRYYSDYE